MKLLKIGIIAELVLLAFASIIIIQKEKSNLLHKHIFQNDMQEEKSLEVMGDGYIKWVDFKVSYEALCQAYEIDVATYQEPIHINWIELLAYIGAKHGGDFPGSVVKEMKDFAAQLCEGKITIEEATKNLKYYSYYLEAYTAVLAEYVGEYEIQEKKEDGSVVWVKKYGLKNFSPIAKGFEYHDYDDFGSSRSYGYKRVHLGHDMMGQTGTPVWMYY